MASSISSSDTVIGGAQATQAVQSFYDGVFAQVQLISCRNVLIYFDRSLQDRVLQILPLYLLAQRLSEPSLPQIQRLKRPSSGPDRAIRPRLTCSTAHRLPSLAHEPPYAASSAPPGLARWLAVLPTSAVAQAPATRRLDSSSIFPSLELLHTPGSCHLRPKKRLT
jgi:hypothetical protein